MNGVSMARFVVTIVGYLIIYRNISFQNFAIPLFISTFLSISLFSFLISSTFIGVFQHVLSRPMLQDYRCLQRSRFRGPSRPSILRVQPALPVLRPKLPDVPRGGIWWTDFLPFRCASFQHHVSEGSNSVIYDHRDVKRDTDIGG